MTATEHIGQTVKAWGDGDVTQFAKLFSRFVQDSIAATYEGV
jgi:hypothetical protein